MTFGSRSGSREEGLLPLNAQWGTNNALTVARDRRRLGDVNIDYDSHALVPMIEPLARPMQSALIAPMVRRFGENAIDARRMGSRNLWDNTPVVSLAGPSTILGDVEVDVSGMLAEWERVGFRWDRKTSKLCAYLSIGHKTYVVKIPLAKIQKIFNKAVVENGGGVSYFRERSLDGFFKKLGRSLKKAVKGVGKSIVKGITAPVRFVKNPKKFVKDTARDLKKVVKGVGKVAIKVASSPIFAGVMTAIAAIPPLTVVGGIGLAAYAAANAIKPAFNALDKGIDAVEAMKRGKPLRAVKALTSASGIKADGIIKNFSNTLPKLPGPARELMVSALKSTEARKLTPRERARRAKRVAFRFLPRTASFGSSIRRI